MNQWSRKDFLKASLAAGSVALLARNRVAAAVASGSANGDARIAIVGINNQGASHMRTYFNLPGARLVALCDADEAVLNKRVQEAAKENITVKTYRDYRKLLEDPEIDAVVIATPNHWHSLMTIWALQAGKDVYVEKPLSHNIWEGRQAVEAAKKYSNRVAMAGTQNRSSLDIQAAIDYVRAGQLGAVQWARGLCYKPRESIGLTTGPQPVPATVDYELWTGPAALTPPRRNSAKNGTIHYDWHWFWNYGGGDISNQGIHQMDVARWMLGETGLPPSAISIGGRFGYQDDAETPNTLMSVFNYAKAPLIFEVRGLPMKTGMRAMDHYRAAQIGTVLQCEGGYVHAGENGTAIIYDNANKKIKTLAEGGNGDHRKNFVKALHERKVVQGLITEAHFSSCLGHLANLSYLVGAEKSNAAIAEAVKSSEVTKETFGRVLDHLKANDIAVETSKMTAGPLLTIDSATEKFTGPDKEIAAAANASRLRKREGRAPFLVPDMQKMA